VRTLAVVLAPPACQGASHVILAVAILPGICVQEP
jgi:hypothetical protein